MPDANLIIRSSDSVDFQVHKSVLAMVSPIFREMLSLPQPSDGESVGGLPVVELSEDSDLLNSLVSLLYPANVVIPNSYDKVLYLLVTCQQRYLINLTLPQGFVSTRGVSEIRDSFSTVVYPRQGQAQGIPNVKGSRGLLCIRDCKSQRAHPGDGMRSTADLGPPDDIRSCWRRTAIV